MCFRIILLSSYISQPFLAEIESWEDEVHLYGVQKLKNEVGKAWNVGHYCWENDYVCVGGSITTPDTYSRNENMQKVGRYAQKKVQ